MQTVVTIAVSALTSGVVALGIEYAAKPTLEARKERILRHRRELTELEMRVLKIATTCRELVRERLLPDLPDAARKRILDWESQLADMLVSDARALVEFVPRLGRIYPTEVMSLVDNYALRVESTILSDLSRSDKALFIGDASFALLGFLFVPNRPWNRKFRRMRRQTVYEFIETGRTDLQADSRGKRPSGY